MESKISDYGMLFNTEVIGAKGGVIPLKLCTNLLLLMKNQKFW